MTSYLILSGIIILVSGTSFLVIKRFIKKVNSLQFKLDFADRQIEQMQANAESYKTLIKKINKRKIEIDKVKDEIDTATGSKLADLANSV